MKREHWMKFETVEGYKVLRKGRLSCSVGRHGKATAVKYPVNKTVKPKTGWGPLFFFDNKTDAEQFVKEYENPQNLFEEPWTDLKIVRCKAKKIIYPKNKKPKFLGRSSTQADEQLKEAYNENNTVDYKVLQPCKGTSYACEITCLE